MQNNNVLLLRKRLESQTSLHQRKMSSICVHALLDRRQDMICYAQKIRQTRINNEKDIYYFNMFDVRNVFYNEI